MAKVIFYPNRKQLTSGDLFSRLKARFNIVSENGYKINLIANGEVVITNNKNEPVIEIIYQLPVIKCIKSDSFLTDNSETAKMLWFDVNELLMTIPI